MTTLQNNTAVPSCTVAEAAGLATRKYAPATNCWQVLVNIYIDNAERLINDGSRALECQARALAQAAYAINRGWRKYTQA